MSNRLACLLLIAACGRGAPSDTQPPPLPADGIRLVEVASGLSQPLYLTAPAGDARLFIVEQTGKIRIIQNGQLLATPFLDVTSQITSGGERGLLSMAFHPRYAQNGFFYVDYTDVNGDTRVVRYRVSADPNRADPASAQLVLTVAQPYANHNGGLVLFGPDGKLYVGLGDGGGGGDPQTNGQNPAALLGKILRLDVDAGQPYAIPSDNPFVGQTAKRGEIWIWGVRNPWRFSFDPTSGLLYVADVGQGEWEEVNVVPATQGGLNFGWNIMEGMHCYTATSCVQQGLTLPVAEYGHGDGCSITGGYVYRGSAIPAARGLYFYSDYCNGWLRSFRWDGSKATDPRQWQVGDLGNVTSFGEDASHELYITTAGGRVLRFAAAQ
ncbi:MAG TPA: PQQ-dependent sugar dehydrogenase [Longimicrobiaceae bacterium]